MRVEFYKHNINEEDIQRAIEVLRSPWLTTGKVVEEFEEKLASYLGVKYAVAASSCTAALHLSLLAIDAQPGFDIITTPLTFVATSNAIIYTGAKPIFADVDYKAGVITPTSIEKALTPSTLCLMPVHLYGQMCYMDGICDLARKHGLRVIEDSAHCIEGEFNFHKPGSISDGACFSFYPIKSITSGEGGAFVTNDAKLADKVRLMRNHGMTKGADKRYGKSYEHWNQDILGYNYRMTNFQAALLLGQIDRLEEIWERRKEIWNRYTKAFKDNPRIRLLKTSEKHAHLMYTILIQNRDLVLKELQDNGIGIAVHYNPVHLLQYYRNTFGYKEGDFPVTEEIGSQTITLPIYPKLTDGEVDYVIDMVSKYT